MNIKMKSSCATLLALALVTSPIMVNAEKGLEIIPINSEVDLIDTDIQKPQEPNYIEFKGEIKDISSLDDKFSIWAENNLEEGLDKLVAHISKDVVLLDEETTSIVSKDNIKEGMKVSIYFEKNTPMAMSYPPQLAPSLVVIRSEETNYNIKVEKFNESLTSVDNWLKLNISEETKLIDLNGERIEKEDLKNKDLVVFYGASTRSIPAQTTPIAVVAIKNHEVKEFDYLNLNGNKLVLENKMFNDENKNLMIPLREVAKALGFEVNWIDETKSVELKKDDYTVGLTIGLDKYKYYDLEIELGISPEIKEDKTYVPVEFIEKILISSVNVTMDGILEIERN